ncbi:histidinol-phosphatase HisJ family protein [Clostridium sp. OS1-26]|uniref:histidinol-phosphatase HisJ family protein n=1 Tax=Clostridium sp. OS1-26 TaxID=3070681 RepID=UPI0027E0094E|nr:histidinol-phosphatase HisJ family protein [Clostridium sp. OS1-26]WML33034.1 histidinol-phosphatase HisJ family protein [Clostridium sp. OS1-26]
MNYLYDYHIHTTYSTDGNNTIFEVCKSAVEKGLKEIAITDHFEPTRGNENYSEYKPYDYILEIEKAREIFKGKLKIKIGIELGQPHHYMNSSKAIVNSIPYDYVIGSAHKLSDDTDFSEFDYNNVLLENACSTYINELKQLVSRADFDCVGHMDLIKRYSTDIYKRRVSLLTQQELLEEVFDTLISMGKGIEINTSGLRQAPKETMPGIDVLKFYRELGGEILTIGSDSHYAQDVAKGLDVAIENAREAGFKYLTTFSNRVPEFIKISYKNDFYYMDNRKII